MLADACIELVRLGLSRELLHRSLQVDHPLELRRIQAQQ